MITKIVWLLITCLCAGLYASYFGNRDFNERSQLADDYYLVANAPEPHRSKCNNLHNKSQSRISCKEVNNPASEKTDVYLWGDSFASALVPGMTKMAKLHRFNFEFSALAGCGAVLNMQRTDANNNCADGNSRVVDQIIESSPQLVLLLSSYVQRLNDGVYRSVSSEQVANAAHSIKEFEIAIKPTIDKIKSSGAFVAVLTENPSLPVDPVIERMKLMMVGRNNAVAPTTLAQHQARINPVYSLIDDSGIDLRLDYADFFCGSGQCLSEMDGISLYKDRTHISNSTSDILAGKLVDELQALGFLNTQQ